MYPLIAAGVLAALLGGTTWWQANKADKLELERDALRLQLQLVASVNKHNQGAIDRCELVNQVNQEAVQQAVERAKAAEAEAIRLTTVSDLAVEGTENEAADMRETGDQECRTLADPLPDDFLTWVRDDPWDL